MRSEIIIVVSKKEAFINGAQLILEQVRTIGFECLIIFIEDWSLDYNEKSSDQKKIFYFLTNVDEVIACIQDVLRNGHIIINKIFLFRLGEHSKFYLQKIIEQNGISVPKSVCSANNKDICKIDFPCYIKSQKHTSAVIKVSNKKELYQTIWLFDSNNEGWYAEEAIAGDDVLLQKIYYINGKAFAKDNNFQVENVFISISEILGLEVFSVDIFSSKSSKYWVIDVNPAPSFFKLEEARKAFATFLTEKLV